MRAWDGMYTGGLKYPGDRVDDAAIAALAVRQHGNITRRQLEDLGLSDRAITYRVKAGRLHRVFTGVYSVGKPPVTPLERASAAVLACGPGAALSHGSALSLWGLDNHWHTPFEVVVPGDRRPKGIKVHRCTTLARRDITTQLGIRVTTPARALLDTAPRLPDTRLTRAVNDALHSRYMHQSDLAEIHARLPRHPGAARLLPFTAKPRITRSELEDAFLAFCQTHRLPQPQTNIRIAGYLVDAYFPAERLIVEVDSYEFHADRATFESDRDRDADTLLAGFPTVRITYERMQRSPATEAARLRAILSRGRSHPTKRPKGRLK
jgi:very-short-patch-repair endonuclease